MKTNVKDKTKMAFFNKDDYQSAQERISLFWREYPQGRIINEIVSLTETDIIIKTSIYIDQEDIRPVAVDFAHERVEDKGVNSTSHVENCSTSATARGISLLGGIFSPDKKRASREEIQKVARLRNWSLEADQLYAAKDINALRMLMKDAVAIGADPASVAHIKQLGVVLASELESGGSGRKDNTPEPRAESPREND